MVAAYVMACDKLDTALLEADLQVQAQQWLAFLLE